MIKSPYDNQEVEDLAFLIYEPKLVPKYNLFVDKSKLDVVHS